MFLTFFKNHQKSTLYGKLWNLKSIHLRELSFSFCFSYTALALAGPPWKTPFFANGRDVFLHRTRKHYLVFKSGKSYSCKSAKMTSCHNGLAVSTSDSRCGDPGSSLVGGLFSFFKLASQKLVFLVMLLGGIMCCGPRTSLFTKRRWRPVRTSRICRSLAVAWIDSSWSQSRTLLGRCYDFVKVGIPGLSTYHVHKINYHFGRLTTVFGSQSDEFAKCSIPVKTQFAAAPMVFYSRFRMASPTCNKKGFENLANRRSQNSFPCALLPWSQHSLCFTGRLGDFNHADNNILHCI